MPRTRPLPHGRRAIEALAFLIVFGWSITATAETFTAGNEAALRAAIGRLQNGDTIVFTGDITLTQDLDSIRGVEVTIDGAGHALSGAGKYRGLLIGAPNAGKSDPVSASINNLTIRDTLATGGDGGTGTYGGGGGAGLGGAIFVAENAIVTVSNVSVQGSAARGGAGGDGGISGAVAGGGGGGLGGNGGTGTSAAGGGGGVGQLATGGSAGQPGLPGIVNGAGPGGRGAGADGPGAAGGRSGGGGGGGDGVGVFQGSSAGGGGNFGEDANPQLSGPIDVVLLEAVSGAGGFGGGGGGVPAPPRGTFDGPPPPSFAGAGGYGGGGGGGTAGQGGFGGGAGGGVNSAGFGGGTPTDVNGGGGAAMGGAVFVQAGGNFIVGGAFTVNGSSVTGGTGAGSAGGGAAYGSGLFLDGSNELLLSPRAGQTIVFNDAIADTSGVTGKAGDPSWALVQEGPGRTVLRGVNRYSGPTYIYDGALNVASDLNLGTTGNVVNNGATLEIAGTSTFSRRMTLSGTATIAVAPGQTATWNGEIANGGSNGLLRVRGGGTLALTNGGNDYALGTAVIENSTLAAASDGALGRAGSGVALGDSVSGGRLAVGALFSSFRPMLLGAGGGTVDVGTGDATWQGTISGAGSLTKSGGGMLTLAGTNAYGGATRVAGGTLKAGAAGVFGTSGQMAVDAGATLDISDFDASFASIGGAGNITIGNATLGLGDSGNSTFNGRISGTGTVVKNGGGTLFLGGVNSYGGKTYVKGGTLVGNTGSLQGDIVNDASVVFDQGGDGIYSGSLSGGSLTKAGAGALTLTGGNNPVTTSVSAGTLIASTSSLRGAIQVNGGQLRFDQSSDGTLQGSLIGGGSFIKTGAGRLTLNDAGSLSGLLTIQQGGLTLNGPMAGSAAVRSGANFAMNGAVAGAVTVDSGGLFSGLGSVGPLNIAGEWTVPAFGSVPAAVRRTSAVPGAALNASDAPTLTVNGDLATVAGSRVNIEAGPGPKAPVQVNGGASFAGTQFNITVNDNSNRRLASYPLVSANAVSLASSTASTQAPSLVPQLYTDATTLRVSVLNVLVPLAGVATTTNGRAVAGAVDQLKPGTGEMGGFIRNLAGLEDDPLRDAFDQIAGEVNVTNVKMVTMDSEAITDLIRDQMSRDAEEEGDVTLAAATLRPRFWAEFAASRARFSSSSGVQGGVVNLGGVASGFDIKRSDAFTFGAGLSFTGGGLSLDDLKEASHLTAPRGFGYAGVRVGPLRFHGGASAAKTNTNSTREIHIEAANANVTGLPAAAAFDRTAEADRDGSARDVWSELQETLTIKAWTTEAKVGWRHAHFSRQPFTEEGGGPVSIQGGEDSISETESDVMVRSFKHRGAYRPNFMFTYRREFGDQTNEEAVQFVGQPGARFVVQGLPLAQNTVIARSGLTVHTASGLEYMVDYEFRHAEFENRHSGHFRIRFR